MLSKAKVIEKMVLPTPFVVGPVNVYLIKSDSLTLVDTGPKTDLAKANLISSINSLGYAIDDIDQVVLTHHHPDHVGLIEELFPRAKIIGHTNCNPWVRKDQQFLGYLEQYFSSFFREHAVPEKLVESMVETNRILLSYTGTRKLDQTVADGEKIDGIPGWRVIETLGHAQSHISLFHEKDGILLGGDHIISTISSNAILEPPTQNDGDRPKTLIQYRHSLQKCLDIGTKVVYSGHGEKVENVSELILKRFSEQDKKAAKLKKLIADNGSTSFQLCEQYFQHIYKKEPMLTMSEVIGHLDLLLERNEIRIEENNGIIFYKRI